MISMTDVLMFMHMLPVYILAHMQIWILMHIDASRSEASSKKSDLALSKILNSFGVEGEHTFIADARRQDPGLVLWWQAEYR